MIEPIMVSFLLWNMRNHMNSVGRRTMLNVHDLCWVVVTTMNIFANILLTIDVVKNHNGYIKRDAKFWKAKLKLDLCSVNLIWYSQCFLREPLKWCQSHSSRMHSSTYINISIDASFYLMLGYVMYRGKHFEGHDV